MSSTREPDWQDRFSRFMQLNAPRYGVVLWLGGVGAGVGLFTGGVWFGFWYACDFLGRLAGG